MSKHGRGKARKKARIEKHAEEMRINELTKRLLGLPSVTQQVNEFTFTVPQFITSSAIEDQRRLTLLTLHKSKLGLVSSDAFLRSLGIPKE